MYAKENGNYFILNKEKRTYTISFSTILKDVARSDKAEIMKMENGIN